MFQLKNTSLFEFFSRGFKGSRHLTFCTAYNHDFPFAAYLVLGRFGTVRGTLYIKPSFYFNSFEIIQHSGFKEI